MRHALSIALTALALTACAAVPKFAMTGPPAPDATHIPAGGGLIVRIAQTAPAGTTAWMQEVGRRRMPKPEPNPASASPNSKMSGLHGVWRN